jgi:hypothetical protein
MNNFNPDKRQFASATERNREPILQVLQQFFPSEGAVLEIAAGTGQHAHFFTSHFPSLVWYPSDHHSVCRDSIQAWQDFEPRANLQSPLNIDVTQENWWEIITAKIKVIVCINMIHISPWSACLGLFKGAQILLENGGILYLYGPYFQEGKVTAPSNVEFDHYLRSQNEKWGLRNLEEVILMAQKHNFQLKEIVPMPANNLSVIFEA